MSHDDSAWHHESCHRHGPMMPWLQVMVIWLWWALSHGHLITMSVKSWPFNSLITVTMSESENYSLSLLGPWRDGHWTWKLASEQKIVDPHNLHFLDFQVIPRIIDRPWESGAIILIVNLPVLNHSINWGSFIDIPDKLRYYSCVSTRYYQPIYWRNYHRSFQKKNSSDCN